MSKRSSTSSDRESSISIISPTHFSFYIPYNEIQIGESINYKSSSVE